MGSSGRAASYSRKQITLNSGRVEFTESGCAVKIVFKPNEIQVGCHTVSLDAWRELVKNYDAYLVGKSEQVYQEGCHGQSVTVT